MSVSPLNTHTVPTPQGLLGLAPAATPTGSGSTATTSPYVQQYNNLLQYDTQELFSVSFGSQQNAQTNIEGVLAQWVGLQQVQQQAQQQAIQSASNKAGANTSNTSNLPTIEDLQSQSDAQASAVLSKYSAAPPGSSILDFQA